MKYYVSEDGSDSNSGAEHQPFKTVKKAENVSKEGDCYDSTRV